MKIEDKLLEELGTNYVNNIENVKNKFDTFYDYVVSYKKDMEVNMKW